MKQDVLPPETLKPSCRDAAELAREIGRLVSQAIGSTVTISSMQLGMDNNDGASVTINWKRGK